MNDAVRKTWKSALTSGEYAQGNHRLRDSNNRFCCLGVLCDLYVKETGKGSWFDTTIQGYIFQSGNDSSTAFLTDDVRKWAGLSEICPGTSSYMLVHANDNGMTFDEIAQMLDEM